MEISWTDRVRNEEVLQTDKKERNILYTAKIKKANWIGHILCRNCLLKHIIERNLEGREDEDDNVSSYRMILRKQGDTVNRRMKH